MKPFDRLIRLIGSAVTVLALSISVAVAADLGEMKNAGLVGERLDGYVGVVAASASADVKAFVQEINRKRRAAYQKIATKNKVGVDQVARISAEKLIARAATGHFVQNAKGTWIKKR